jgi:Lsr2
MAQRVVVTVHDDLDGSTAVETVRFALDGNAYEIDLSAENAARIRGALAPYVEAGRRTTKSGKPFKRTVVTPDTAAIRAWAQARGMTVPTRGRIPKSVVEAFTSAH